MAAKYTWGLLEDVGDCTQRNGGEYNCNTHRGEVQYVSIMLTPNTLTPVPNPLGGPGYRDYDYY